MKSSITLSSSRLLVLPTAIHERQCLDLVPSCLVSPLNLTASQGGGKVGAVHPLCLTGRLREAESQGPHYLVTFRMQSQADAVSS